MDANVHAQKNISPDSANKIIEDHFKIYGSELHRYSDLTFNGEISTVIGEAQIKKELALFELSKRSGLIFNPTDNVFILAHNLLIHSPKAGQESLTLLNKQTTNKTHISKLYAELIFAGEFGEQLALQNLESTDLSWQLHWAAFLAKTAIYDSSIPKINNCIKKPEYNSIRYSLIDALMYIGSPKSINFLKTIIDTTRNDNLQAKAMYNYVELGGYDVINELKKITPVGELANEEKKSGLEWLQNKTSPQNKYGIEIKNSDKSMSLFADTDSPIINYLNNEGFLAIEKVKNPKRLTKEQKNKILDLLIQSKGFGLEAIKANLFLSLEKSDITKLLEIRRMCYYSPNNFTQEKLHTLQILIRYVKKL